MTDFNNIKFFHIKQSGEDINMFNVNDYILSLDRELIPFTDGQLHKNVFTKIMKGYRVNQFKTAWDTHYNNVLKYRLLKGKLPSMKDDPIMYKWLYSQNYKKHTFNEYKLKKFNKLFILVIISENFLAPSTVE